MGDRWKTVGETLIDCLEAHGVEVVFGIPGVHTVELYRGLAGSKIRHVTPRHEQGAGFMADGYARLSGKPGVALVITGPGVTNTITAMGQAREDSVPMLVISGVNARATLGHGRGYLHELPDQQAMMATVSLTSHTLSNPDDLADVVDRAFSIMASRRPGPVHIEIPTDVMSVRIAPFASCPAADISPAANPALIRQAAELCRATLKPVILCGGGAVSCADSIRQLAEAIDAPIVTTVNGRGMFFNHPLSVPASPSLGAVRQLIAHADLVLAFGTEFGQTDYDMYADKGFPEIARLVRVDIDADQLARGPKADVAILSTVEAAIGSFIFEMGDIRLANDGANRADAARKAAWAELPPKLQAEVRIIETIRDTLENCVIVGDSTQAVYAGNLYYDAGRPRGWFNAATGFGALGYGPPAAIGAAIAEPQTSVVCIAGDGGFQFSLAEIGSAKDAKTRVIFLVWNNDGYQEIETYMIDNGIRPEGVKPSSPDFADIARAYGLPAVRLTSISELAATLRRMAAHEGPSLIEIHETHTKGVFG